MITQISDELRQLKKEYLFRELKVQKYIGPTKALINNKEVTLFSGNDYLGLSHHQSVIDAAVEATKKYGTSASASRLISGNNELNEKLENRIAELKGFESALIFPNGYMANLALISTLATKEDIIFIDKYDHASIYDATKLSGATVIRYPHSNIKYLTKKLKDSAIFRQRYIITDGVFSMDGDLAKLQKLKELSRHYDCQLIIDDAHGTGILGKDGKGTSSYLDIKADYEVSTLSKALGSVGGYICCDQPTRDYLINKARSFIFTTALPPACLAAALEALKISVNQKELRQKLLKSTSVMREYLDSAGFNIIKSITPIIPIIVGDEDIALKFSADCLEKGLFIPVIRTPAVQKGKARLRLTLSAKHTENEIDNALQALIDVGKELKIIN